MPIMFRCLVYHKIRNKKRCISKLKKQILLSHPLPLGINSGSVSKGKDVMVWIKRL